MVSCICDILSTVTYAVTYKHVHDNIQFLLSKEGF